MQTGDIDFRNSLDCIPAHPFIARVSLRPDDREWSSGLSFDHEGHEEHEGIRERSI